MQTFHVHYTDLDEDPREGETLRVYAADDADKELAGLRDENTTLANVIARIRGSRDMLRRDVVTMGRRCAELERRLREQVAGPRTKPPTDAESLLDAAGADVHGEEAFVNVEKLQRVLDELLRYKTGEV